jgi:hypothetical protein
MANEKGLAFFFLKKKDLHHIFLMVLNCDTWHNINMPCGITFFGQIKLNSIFK